MSSKHPVSLEKSIRIACGNCRTQHRTVQEISVCRPGWKPVIVNAR